VSNRRVIFVTAIPSQVPCDFGGTGWVMELDANNGGLIQEYTFDVDNDGDFDAEDLVAVGDDDTAAPSGLQSATGLIQQPTIISQPASDIEYKYSSGSRNAGIEFVRENKGAGIRGRVSWEQLR
jgi:type IV pilus assembly protein PilY1